MNWSSFYTQYSCREQICKRINHEKKIILTRNAAEISAIKMAYEKLLKKDLEKDSFSETNISISEPKGYYPQAKYDDFQGPLTIVTYQFTYDLHKYGTPYLSGINSGRKIRDSVFVRN